VKVNGLPFTVVGTFKERVDTFGQSEVTDNTLAMPYTVARYFTDTPTVKQLYFSVGDASMVDPATEQIRHVLQSRHRPESIYRVDNLTQLVSLADKVTNMMTLVLALISLVVLLVSGIGIMNIMLSTVSARIREIGNPQGDRGYEPRDPFSVFIGSDPDFAGRWNRGSDFGSSYSILRTFLY
jgi:putative ABC transport system permease protein